MFTFFLHWDTKCFLKNVLVTFFNIMIDKCTIRIINKDRISMLGWNECSLGMSKTKYKWCIVYTVYIKRKQKCEAYTYKSSYIHFVKTCTSSFLG